MFEIIRSQFSFNQLGISVSWAVVAIFTLLQLSWIGIRNIKKSR